MTFPNARNPDQKRWWVTNIGITMLVVVASLMTVFAWAAASPPQSSPDDDYHLPSIWCRGAQHGELCEPISPVAVQGDVQVAISTLPLACYKSLETAEVSCTEPTEQLFRISSWNYPPLFYNALSWASGDGPYDNQIAMRFLAGSGAVAIFLLSYLVASPRYRQAALVSWVVTSIPVGLLLFASTNPSSWAIAGIAAMWPALLTAFTDDAPLRRYLAAGVWALAALMAAGSRGDAAAFVAAINVVAVVLLLRGRKQILATVTALVLTTTAVAFFLGSGQSRAVEASFGDRARSGVADTIWSFVLAFPSLLVGTPGEPWGVNNVASAAGGWLDILFQPTTWILMLLVIGGLAMLGLGHLNLSKSIAMVAILGLAVVIPLRALMQVGMVVGENFQPRYLMPLFVLLMGIILIRPDGLWFRLSRGQTAVMWVLMVFASTIALHSVISRFAHGLGTIEPDLNNEYMWWSLSEMSPMAVWIVGSCAWAVVISVALLHLRSNQQSLVPRYKSLTQTSEAASPVQPVQPVPSVQRDQHRQQS